MKRLILLALLCAGPAAATTKAELCESFGELAETFMESRQIGIPMSQMMLILPQVDAEVLEMAALMIKMAYSQPMLSYAENQKKAIVRFRDQIEVACFASNLGGES